jgi:putative transposase
LGGFWKGDVGRESVNRLFVMLHRHCLTNNPPHLGQAQRVLSQNFTPRITEKSGEPLAPEVRHMRKSRYSHEQIATALRQAEAGRPVTEITRKLGISEATFYAWKKRFGSLGTPEIRELRQLRTEMHGPSSWLPI